MIDDPIIGKQLANYRIERVLGRGGMAAVYYGTDIQLQRPAAIKVIDAHFRGKSAYVDRFIQEARAVATWRHEHILQVYYADVIHLEGLEGVFFFAMEYIAGQNLADVLADYAQRGEKVPFAEVLRYGRAVAAALDYAHARGVIHRDVKPSNVLVSNDGRVMLSDFGLSLDTQQGSLGEVFGTAHYMAPEQARRSNAAVPQSDLYSLGVILYEMLCGVVPFDDPSPTSVALQHITQPVPAPRSINPQLGVKVETVLLKALSKDPVQRYQSGEALMAAMEAALREMAPAQPTVKNGRKPTRGLPGMETLSGWLRSAPKLFYIRVGVPFLIALILLAMALPQIFGRLSKTQQGDEPAGSTAEVARSPAFPSATQTIQITAAQSASTPESFETPAPAVQVTEPPPDPTTAVPTTAPEPAQTATTVPIANPTPTWTPKYASGRRMVLMWDANSFYMLQVTGYGDLIAPLAFERLDADGLGMERFSGKLWAEYHASTLRDWCMRLVIGGAGSPELNPPQCKKQYVSTRWPMPGDSTLFWTPKDGTQIFRVMWGQQEIQRCEISAGRCEVYLP